VALIAVLATVAFPGPAGSRVPSPFDQPDVDLFQQAEMAAAVRGTAMTTEPFDPGARSDGNLDPNSTVFEPAQQTEPPQARSDAALPEASATTVRRNPWRFDDNVSWYGPGLYGNGMACGGTLTRRTVGVAHRTLPCGTLIEFRNPENGLVVIAPVVDRGPFVSGRSWDLAAGLCDNLNHCHTGAIEWRYAKAS
jgi:rare lipoprotein A (peptidoglycan hydrolase)